MVKWTAKKERKRWSTLWAFFSGTELLFLTLSLPIPTGFLVKLRAPTLKLGFKGRNRRWNAMVDQKSFVYIHGVGPNVSCVEKKYGEIWGLSWFGKLRVRPSYCVYLMSRAPFHVSTCIRKLYLLENRVISCFGRNGNFRPFLTF